MILYSLNSMQDKCQSIEELWISLTEINVNTDSLNKLILSQRGLKDCSFGISNDLLVAL